jgi:hypothetical protein
LRGPGLFCRSRAVIPALGSCGALVLLAATPIGSLLVPVGVLTGSTDQSVAARIVFTLVVTAAVLAVTEQPLVELEGSAARPMRPWHWSAVIFTIMVGCLAMWATASVAGSSAEPLVRNALGLTGLGLLARAWWGRLAWLAPLVWVMASVLFGYESGPGAAPWAWPIAEHAPSAWAWAAATLALGLATLAATGKQ